MEFSPQDPEFCRSSSSLLLH